MIRPSERIRRRAWECAFALDQEFSDRLSETEARAVAIAAEQTPDDITWTMAALLFSVAHCYIEVRV